MWQQFGASLYESNYIYKQRDSAVYLMCFFEAHMQFGPFIIRAERNCRVCLTIECVLTNVYCPMTVCNDFVVVPVDITHCSTADIHRGAQSRGSPAPSVLLYTEQYMGVYGIQLVENNT